MNGPRNLLIRASAGTGKTFQLSNRYLQLIYAGVAPDQILATTFTRKAAGEIIDRVMMRLAKAAASSTACGELAEELGIATLTREHCRTMLRALVNRLHRLRICTLDAFFAQLAGSFSLELGLPAGWRIVEPLVDRNLRLAAIEEVLHGDSLQDLQRLMGLLTKGEAQRSVQSLVDETVKKLYSLFLETESAAWHCIPRPRKLKSEQLDTAIEHLRDAELPDHKSINTAHENSLNAAMASDWESFIGKGIPASLVAGKTVYYRKEIAAATVQLYQPLIDHARAVLIEELANQTEATYQLLDKYHHRYQALKRQSRGLRFEDVTRCLAQQHDQRQIDQQHFRLDAPLRHLLLDEFQDTSLIQWRVLQPFAEHVMAAEEEIGGDQGRSFFCVGDAKQAIYGWRGGRSEIFEALNDGFPGLAQETLSKSYRSAQPIIDTVNRVFQGIAGHTNLERHGPMIDRWCQQFPQHATARQELPGYVEMRAAPLAADGESQTHVTCDYAAEWIEQLVKKIPEATVGVLVRKNSTVAHLIHQLRARGVPASEEGGNPLTDSSGVQVILSLFRLADHPGDGVARYHLANSPLATVCQLTDHRDIDAGCRLASHMRRELLESGYGPTVYRWVKELYPKCHRRDRSRLRQLVELAYRYQEIASLRPGDFLKYVDEQRVADPTTAEVRVMTIHQAKGLQFDVVVLAELDGPLVGQPDICVVEQAAPTEPISSVCRYRNENVQNLLPPELRTLFDGTAEQKVHEALCVLYVALTRPVHALQMIIAPASPREKKLPKTAAGLLRAALTDGEVAAPDSVLFQTGDVTWLDQLSLVDKPTHETVQDEQDRLTNVVQSATEADSGILPKKSGEAGERLGVRMAPPLPGARPRNESPSSLEGGTRVSVARLFDGQNSAAMRRGTLMHAWYEQVEWLDEQVPDRTTLERVAQQVNTDGVDVSELLDQFLRTLEMPQIRQVLSHDGYRPPYGEPLSTVLPSQYRESELNLELHRERTFCVLERQRLLTGSIDRLVLLYQDRELVSADLLDFKTDWVKSSDSTQLAERCEFYRPQLMAYRSAVSSMFGLPIARIAARLVFVRCGNVVTV
jgi:ATP-dependent helicase/nuclease subunit A